MEKTTTFPLRYSVYVLSIAGLLVSLPVTLWLGAGYLFPVIFGALTALGTWDLISFFVQQSLPHELKLVLLSP